MSIFPFSFCKRKARRPEARTVLTIEPFEDRCLPNCTTISGYVYNDANDNGIRDLGEQAIAGSTVKLFDASHVLVATTVTDANGYYEFNSDPRVSTAPATLTHTVSFPQAATDWSASQAIPQFDPSLGTLTSVEIINNDQIASTIKVENLDGAPATIHATVAGTVTLSGPGVPGLVTNLSADQTFAASAFDGTVDFGGTSGHDFGPKSATGSNSVTLTAPSDLAAFIGTGNVSFTEAAHGTSNGSGAANLLLSIHTQASGSLTLIYHYTPSNCLAAGAYTIVQPHEPAGFFDGLETRGNVTPLPGTVGTDVISVTLTDDANLTNNNFGEVRPSALSGYVYFDHNDNAIKGPLEKGIGGVTVTLTGTDDTGAAVNLSQVTAADGSYSFVNLRPGTYTLSESQPGAYLDGKDTIGSPGGATGNDIFSAIALPGGTNGVNNNFGELKPASLAGFVYYDHNDNGIKGPAEQGIGNVTVTLTGTDDLGNPVSLQQTTASDGSYAFTGLRPGTYTISESQPAAWLQGKNTIGTPGGSVGFDQFTNVSLAAGVDGANNNFGELVPASVAGFVYSDANDNGVKDSSEQGIAGTTVTLTGIDDQGHTVSLTQTTLADGSYAFTGLRPGTYAITETQPAGWLQGQNTIGSQGGLMGVDQFTNVVLAAGVNGVNNNFGEVKPASLSGFVYFDANDNGVKDAGEQGLFGCWVALTGYDDHGQFVTKVVTTAADGSYSFSGLRPGTYVITEAQPVGWDDGKDALGTAGGVKGNDQVTSIALAAGLDGTHYDFGELMPVPPSHIVPPPPPPPPPPLPPPPPTPDYSKITYMVYYVPGVGLVQFPSP